MATGVNLYELMHGFWKENDYEPFPASATALFFFLLERANSRHWNMPIRCPTAVVSRTLMVSEQTVINSRNALYRRGIITFTKGSGNTAAPSYIIITDPKHWAVRLGDSYNDDLSDSLGDHLGDELGEGLNIYNKKDKKIKNQIFSLYKAGEKKFLSLDELERQFLFDKEWQVNLISFLSKDATLDAYTLQRQITHFFQFLRCNGTTGREEKECRTHFVNWIRKQIIKEQRNGNDHQRNEDKRRGTEITPTSSEDYHGAFFPSGD